MENQKKQREKSKQLKSKTLFNLTAIIQVSFVISLFTQILFIYILTSSYIPRKVIGIALHIALGVTIALSLKSSLHNNLSKYANKLNLYMKLILLFLISLLIYYITLIHTLNKIDDDIDNNTILFFIFSITISGMFHGLLLFAISSFVSQVFSKTTNGTLQSSSLQDDNAIKETMIRSDTLN